ncbi:MAG: hypothetical protein ACXV5Q_16775 [Frankiaceae bacterium]
MAQPRSTARRLQAVRDAGLRRLSGATVALTVTSLAGVGVVAAVVKSATEHSAHRSAPSSATTETGQPDTSQSGGTGGSGSGSAGSGSSGLVPDQSGSDQIQPPAYDPAPVPGYRQPHTSSGGS